MKFYYILLVVDRTIYGLLPNIDFIYFESIPRICRSIFLGNINNRSNQKLNRAVLTSYLDGAYILGENNEISERVCMTQQFDVE